MIKRDKTIAVAVDYQERLMPVMFNREEVTETSVKFLKGLKILGIDIYITQQYTRGLGDSVPEIYEAAGTNDYVEKISFGAAEDLMKAIPSPEEKPYVLICGVESHICVLQTALGLKEARYIPVMVTDCISSRRKKDLKIMLMRCMQEGIILTTYESVLFELLKRAGTDEFRQISRLVK